MAILGSCDYTDWGWWSLVVRTCTYVMNWFIRHDSFTPWTNLLFFFFVSSQLWFFLPCSEYGVKGEAGGGERGCAMSLSVSCGNLLSFFFFGEGWNTL